MTVPVAVSQLLDIEETRDEGYLNPGKTLAVGLSNVGGGDTQRIVAGTLQALYDAEPELYGEPLHSLVIVGKRLHHLEAEYLWAYALNEDVWRGVVENVYGCKLE